MQAALQEITPVPKTTVQYLHLTQDPKNENIIWAGTDDGNLAA